MSQPIVDIQKLKQTIIITFFWVVDSPTHTHFQFVHL